MVAFDPRIAGPPGGDLPAVAAQDAEVAIIGNTRSHRNAIEQQMRPPARVAKQADPAPGVGQGRRAELGEVVAQGKPRVAPLTSRLCQVGVRDRWQRQSRRKRRRLGHRRHLRWRRGRSASHAGDRAQHSFLNALDVDRAIGLESCDRHTVHLVGQQPRQRLAGYVSRLRATDHAGARLRKLRGRIRAKRKIVRLRKHRSDCTVANRQCSQNCRRDSWRSRSPTTQWQRQTPCAAVFATLYTNYHNGLG